MPRVRILLIALVLALTAGTALDRGWMSRSFATLSGRDGARNPIPVEPMATEGLPLGEALNRFDPAGDFKAFEGFKALVQARLVKGDYPALGECANDLLKGAARFPGGEWKYHAFMEALAACPGGSEQPSGVWAAHLGRLKRWSREHPEVPFPKLALARAMVDYGWRARGSAYASSVSPLGWLRFHSRLKEARDLLGSMADDPNKTLFWYRIRLMVALGLDESVEAYDSIFKAAVMEAPSYWGFYRQKCVFLSPKWHGRPGQWVEWLDAATQALDPKYADAYYYQTVCAMAEESEEPPLVFLKAPHLDWARMKRGFALVDRDCGMELSRLNQFFMFAVFLQDRDQAKALLTRIRDRWDPDYFNDKEIREGKDWVNHTGRFSNCP